MVSLIYCRTSATGRTSRSRSRRWARRPGSPPRRDRGRGPRRSGSRPPRSRTARRSRARCWRAAAVGAGAWLAGDGVALVLVQAPTAKTVASPRARNLRELIVRCSSLAIVSANLHARDRGGDPAGGPGTRGVSCDHLLQVHGRAARRGPGPRLATRSPPPFRVIAAARSEPPPQWRPSARGSRLPIRRHRRPGAGDGRHRMGAPRGRARIAARSSSRARRTGRRNVSPAPRHAAAEHDAADVVGHDQLVHGAGDPAARGVGDLEGEGVAGGGLAVDVDRGDGPVRPRASWRAPASRAASAWTPDGRARRRRPRSSRAGRTGSAGPAGSRTTWPISPASPRDAAVELAVEDDAGRDPGADAEVGEVADVGQDPPLVQAGGGGPDVVLDAHREAVALGHEADRAGGRASRG